MRLRELESDAVARDAAVALSQRAATLLAALGAATPPMPEVSRAPVYREVRALAEYAISERGPMGSRPIADRVEEIARLYDARTIGEPANELEMVLQGALARDKLERGEELAATELAILVGYDRDAVLNLAASVPGAYRSSLPRKPWRFKVTRGLRTWLAERTDTDD